MGIIVSVYRNAEINSDSTNNGISSRFVRLCVMNVDGPFHPSDDTPAVLLVSHPTQKGVCRIVPAVFAGNEYVPAGGWFMMGGNYASTSDSRFVRKVEEIVGHRFYGAVAIHDRQE